jgi:hypothetical protein
MTLIEKLTLSLESDPRLPPSPGDIEEAIVEITRLKALLEEAESLLRIYGDINKATKLLKKIGESK